MPSGVRRGMRGDSRTSVRPAATVGLFAALFAAESGNPVYCQDFRAAEGVESFTSLEGELVTEVPIELEGNWLIVPVDARGRMLRFILDTGATAGAVARSVARRLNLPIVAQARLSGASGRALAPVAEVRWLRVGEARSGDFQKWVLSDGLLSDGDDLRFDGIVGSDLLKYYDILIDVPSRMLKLYKRGTTSANSGPVVGQASAVPFKRQLGGIIRFDVLVNGETVAAILDTGSPSMILNTVAAEAAGVTVSDEPVSEEARGIGSEKVPTYSASIDALEVGSVQLDSVDGEVADLPIFDRLGLDDEPAMLLGSPFLLRCPLLISWRERELRFCRRLDEADTETEVDTGDAPRP